VLNRSHMTPSGPLPGTSSEQLQSLPI
jgi:hypothetical protein